jgi:hypothetical protein
MRRFETARVHPSPDFVLEEATGGEGLPPQIFRRLTIFGEELSQRD